VHRWCSIGADVQMCIVAGAGGEVQLCRGAGVGSGVGAVPRCRCRGAEGTEVQRFIGADVEMLMCRVGAEVQQG